MGEQSQMARNWPDGREHRDGLLLRLLIRNRRLVSVAFALLSRDEHNNPFVVDPDSDDGRRQLAALEASSAGVRLTAEMDAVSVWPD